jgi:2-polyprenyl-6-methoxyphenol hydroxylase-like FAD-dependent oxidoreductase
MVNFLWEKRFEAGLGEHHQQERDFALPSTIFPMARPFDVCIRGGGITGRTLALLLARERLRIGFVSQDGGGAADAKPDVAAAAEPGTRAHGKADVRAFALNLKSKELLESIRCWPSAADTTPVLSMQVQGDDGGEVAFNAADCGAPALAWIVDVPVLEAQLAQAMQFQPQIELLQAPEPATLTVVCEGKASSSRAEFGVDFEVNAYAQRAIAARVNCEKPHGQAARQWFSHEGILGVLPMGGATEDAAATAGMAENSLAIVWSIDEARAQALLAMSPEDFCRALQVATHDCFGALTLTSERVIWPLQLARTDRWAGTTDGVSWALAGDAAHTVHPLTGQGLNLGLADVAELASLIAGRDYWRSVADEKLLRRYERSRKADAAALGSVTDGLQRLFGQNGSGWQALRNAGMSGFERIGPLKKWVARQAMGA